MAVSFTWRSGRRRLIFALRFPLIVRIAAGLLHFLLETSSASAGAASEALDPIAPNSITVAHWALPIGDRSAIFRGFVWKKAAIIRQSLTCIRPSANCHWIKVRRVADEWHASSMRLRNVMSISRHVIWGNKKELIYQRMDVFCGLDAPRSHCRRLRMRRVADERQECCR